MRKRDKIKGFFPVLIGYVNLKLILWLGSVYTPPITEQWFVGLVCLWAFVTIAEVMVVDKIIDYFDKDEREED